MERIRRVAPGAILRFVPKLGEAEDGLADVEAIAGNVKPVHLRHASRLKWVHTWAAGPDNDLFQEMLLSPVVLTSSAGNGASPLSEHYQQHRMSLLMMMLSRDVPRWMRAQAGTAGSASHTPN